MQTKKLEPTSEYVLAPDGSEVRPLLDLRRGGLYGFRISMTESGTRAAHKVPRVFSHEVWETVLGHCTLPPQAVSQAVCHQTIEEIWYFISGQGEIWRKQGDHEDVVEVGPGVCLTIPTGVHFQFRNTGDEPLEFLMATMPPWPGADEAVRVPDYWEPQ